MNQEPWLTKDFIEIFKCWNTSSWEMFEWGSGGSTLWFGQRVKRLHSVEHNEEWHKKVKTKLEEARLFVDFHFIPLEDPRYISLIQEYGDFDCVLIDGRKRVKCGLNAMERIKPLGILVLDNAERPYYQALHEELKNWEHYSTFNGEWKTDWWVKP